MKVLQINAVHGLGSTGRLVSELAAELESRGIASRVAVAKAPPEANAYVIGNEFERKAHALASRVSGKQAYFSARGTRRLLSYIAAEAPDVVHLHNLHSNYVHLPMLLGYLAAHDVATVLTLHDCWFYTGKCCHYTADGCNRWTTGCGSCPRLHNDNPSWFRDATAAVWADKARLFRAIPRLAVVGVSDWVTEEARRSFLADAVILRCVHNWVNLDVFAPADRPNLKEQLGLDGMFVILGVASHWTEAKGLSEFVWLADALNRREVVGASTQLQPILVMVGEMPNRWVAPAGVKVVGGVESAEELATYYAAADVFLQLSAEETFGNVTAEALACGTPVIAYDATANPELIGSGCGFVIDPGDRHQLCARIDEVIRSTKGSFAHSCRSFACVNFDKVVQAEEYVAVYSELDELGRGRPR